MEDFLKRNFRMFERDDPANGAGDPTPEPDNNAGQVTFTVEQIKQMEAHKAELRAEYEEKLKNQETTVRETVLREQEEQKSKAEKESLLAKISENESLKKKFETYKLSPSEMSSKELNTHIDIFNDVISKNTAAPEGGKIDTKPTTINETVGAMEKRMAEKLGGK